MANVIILKNPVSVFVDEGSSSVTFSASGTTLGTSLSDNPVVYRWFTKDQGTGVGTIIPDATGDSLTLSPIAGYDNDTFYAGMSALSADNEVFTAEATFAIRVTSDQYSAWETATEAGANRVRRLLHLGYM